MALPESSLDVAKGQVRIQRFSIHRMKEYSSRAGYVHAHDPMSRHPQQTADTLQFIDG
jgi:hypothetical protein